MMANVFSRLEKALTIALIALSLLFVGFGHVWAQKTLDFSAYTLPDGSKPIICINSGDTDETLSISCEACRLSSGFCEPNAHITLLANALANGNVLAFTQQSFWPLPHVKARSSRGPPTIA